MRCTRFELFWSKQWVQQTGLQKRWWEQVSEANSQSSRKDGNLRPEGSGHASSKRRPSRSEATWNKASQGCKRSEQEERRKKKACQSWEEKNARGNILSLISSARERNDSMLVTSLIGELKIYRSVQRSRGAWRRGRPGWRLPSCRRSSDSALCRPVRLPVCQPWWPVDREGESRSSVWDTFITLLFLSFFLLFFGIIW